MKENITLSKFYPLEPWPESMYETELQSIIEQPEQLYFDFYIKVLFEQIFYSVSFNDLFSEDLDKYYGVFKFRF